MTTHYDILEVAEHASPEVIEAAWRVLVRRYHPDVNEGSEAQEKIRLVNDAHTVLSDEQKRRTYDLQMRADRAAEARQYAEAHQAQQQQHAGVRPQAYPAPYPEATFDQMAADVGAHFIHAMLKQNPNARFFFTQIFNTPGHRSVTDIFDKPGGRR